MRAKGMAAVLELIEELRKAVSREREAATGRRDDRVRAAQAVETLWTDLATLLNEENQQALARLDAWLLRVEAQLEAGGEVTKLVELGLKLTDRRAQLLKLDARATIQPVPMQWVADVTDLQIENEETVERIRRGEPDDVSHY